MQPRNNPHNSEIRLNTKTPFNIQMKNTKTPFNIQMENFLKMLSYTPIASKKGSEFWKKLKNSKKVLLNSTLSIKVWDNYVHFQLMFFLVRKFMNFLFLNVDISILTLTSIPNP